MQQFKAAIHANMTILSSFTYRVVVHVLQDCLQKRKGHILKNILAYSFFSMHCQ